MSCDIVRILEDGVMDDVDGGSGALSSPAHVAVKVAVNDCQADTGLPRMRAREGP